MADHVCVVGAGAAGMASAWSARRRGARVTLIDAGTGATVLTSGALDVISWELIEDSSRVLGVTATARPLDGDAVDFIHALGDWRVRRGDEPLAQVCTDLGRIRCASGHDGGVLDLVTLPERARILVPRFARRDWDADALARTLQSESVARTRGLEFLAADVDLCRAEGERALPASDFALLHDEEERIPWAAHRILARAQSTRFDAVLVGPWLGADRPRADSIGERIGVAVGETLSSIGGVAGLRFEAARRRLLAGDEVRWLRDRARAIARRGDGFVVTLEHDIVSCDSVVLAIGGLVGGGVEWAPAADPCPGTASDPGRHPFRLSLVVDVPIGLGRRDAGRLACGLTFDETAWPSLHSDGDLERVGVDRLPGGAPDGLFAAGDVVAARPRTMLEAVTSGVRAGNAAARWAPHG